MKKNAGTRLHGLFGAVIAIALATVQPSVAETLEDVIAGARKEGTLLWYDSLPAEEGNAILNAFMEVYPFIKATYLEVPGSAKAARFMQESRAGGPTADVRTNSPAGMHAERENGFLLPIDWKALQVPESPEMTPNEYMIAFTTVTYVVIYNKDKVKAEELPGTWEALLDPKWKKRIGAWSRAVPFLTFDSAWGEAKMTSFVHDFAKLEPRLFRSTYTVAQAVGAGEVDIAFAIYHTTLPTIEKGAPVGIALIEPVPIQTTYVMLMKYGKNPNAGKLFLKWLGTREGALTYEKISKRGNYLIPETDTARMLAGKKLSYDTAQQEIDKADRYNRLESDYGRILAGR